jgi:exodeoxyribonuclease VII small subunit
MTDTFNFEQAFIRLEHILEQMNSGKVSLDDSLKLYEEADKLIHACGKRLNEAEQKIETLLKNRSGDLVLNEQGAPSTQPFASREHS